MRDNIIDNTVLLLSRLQGIGPRSARRILFDLMKKKEGLLRPLLDSLGEVYDRVTTCSECRNLDIVSPCSVCSNSNRNRSMLCVVEDVGSLWAIERASEKSGSFNGLYFVLGGTLSATRGATPESLNIEVLLNRIDTLSVSEVILATSSTIEGKITNDYIVSKIPTSVKVSTLAQGIPMGGEIDYLDEMTLSTAINLRKNAL